MHNCTTWYDTMKILQQIFNLTMKKKQNEVWLAARCGNYNYNRNVLAADVYKRRQFIDRESEKKLFVCACMCNLCLY